jgi:hypothetical protein
MLERLDAALTGTLRKIGIEPFIMLTARPHVAETKIATPPVREIVTVSA